MTIHPPRPLRRPAARELTMDLTEAMRTDEIQKLLFALNDMCASAAALADHIDGLTVLRARVVNRYIDMCGDRDRASLTEQVAFLGNRELERILLMYLEDLVWLRCTGSTPPGPLTRE